MPVLPSLEKIADFYSTYNQNYSGGGGSQGRNLERYAQRYLQLVKRYAAANRNELIDVGSSNNPFPNLAAANGFSTTVLDFTRPPDLSTQVGFIAGSTNDLALTKNPGTTFDVVTCWAVLEHVADPRLSAQVLAGLCRPGGTLLLSTPEIGTALTRYSLGRSPWFYPPEHLCLVSPKAIQMIFEPLGFTLLRFGRLELTWLRYLARYGLGCAEAALGSLVQTFSPQRWLAARDARVHSFAGVAYFVFRKAGGVGFSTSPGVRRAE